MHSPGSRAADRRPNPSAAAGEAAPAGLPGPADVLEDLRAVNWLCGPAGRREAEELASRLPLSPAQLQRLRERVGRRPAEWLMTTGGLAKAAEEKFARGGLLVTDRALQQSTDSWIAAYKAGRFPAGQPVWDLCCGVGGDAMALAQRGPLVAVDRDPVVCRLAAHNLARAGAPAAAVVCQSVDPANIASGAWVHLDPDRRTHSQRVSDPQHSEPPPATIDAILARAAGGAIKLAPAADVPQAWASAGGREWISRGGSCRQQVVWFGAHLPAAGRAATVIDSQGAAHTFAADSAECVPVENATSPGEWIFDFDPAVRAAGLTEALAARLELCTLGGPAGFLTADGLPEADDAASPLYSAFAALWRGAMDEKKLRRTLAELEVGSLEIKLRGVDLTPERLRKRLLPGRQRAPGRPLSLLIGRSEPAGRVYAVVAERYDRRGHV